jgi:hypothetical protein
MKKHKKDSIEEAHYKMFQILGIIIIGWGIVATVFDRDYRTGAIGMLMGIAVFVGVTVTEWLHRE